MFSLEDLPPPDGCRGRLVGTIVEALVGFEDIGVLSEGLYEDWYEELLEEVTIIEEPKDKNLIIRRKMKQKTLSGGDSSIK